MLSHEKYIKKALKTLGMGLMSKEFTSFDLINKKVEFYTSVRNNDEYYLIVAKDTIRDYDSKRKEFVETKEKINTMLNEFIYQFKRKELIGFKNQIDDVIYQLDDNYNIAKKQLEILPERINSANWLIDLFLQVEPQCLIEEMKVLNKGKNYEYFMVA